jgi:serine/threonine protein kinase
MAKLLAAGDVRKNFILKSGFLVTEFVENCRDGRDFCPDGIFAERADLRNEFICQNLTFLAKLHKMRILHRGSTPANFLYRLSDDTLEIIWIDVASCHHVPWLLPLRSGIKRDLELLLKPFKLSSEEQQKYMEYYSRQKQSVKL